MPDLLQAAVVLVLSVVLLRYHASPESPAFAYLASFIIVGLISLCLVFMKFPFLRERTTLNKETFVSLVQFGVPIAIGSVFTSLLASIDIVALTYFASLSDVAFYTAALATANIVRYIPKAVSTAIFPVSAELSVTNNPQFGPGLAKLYLYMFVAVAPFSAVLIALADQILALLFGTQFVAGSRALQILAAGAVFSAVQPVNLNIIMGIGRPKEYMRLALITGVSSVIALAILTPLWGSTGAAIGIVIAFVLSYIISIRTIKSNVPFNFPWKKYILTALAAILLGLVLLAIETFFDPTLVWTAVSVVAGGLLYLLLLTALRVISPRDFGLELRGWKFHRSRRL